jgi:hypothetical protein
MLNDQFVAALTGNYQVNNTRHRSQGNSRRDCGQFSWMPPVLVAIRFWQVLRVGAAHRQLRLRMTCWQHYVQKSPQVI